MRQAAEVWRVLYGVARSSLTQRMLTFLKLDEPLQHLWGSPITIWVSDSCKKGFDLKVLSRLWNWYSKELWLPSHDLLLPSWVLLVLLVRLASAQLRSVLFTNSMLLYSICLFGSGDSLSDWLHVWIPDNHSYELLLFTGQGIKFGLLLSCTYFGKYLDACLGRRIFQCT